jgi:hypothetical protein
MNIVRLSNKIAFITVIGMMYWVFIYLCISVFDLKVFRHNMTEMFFMSIFGIFSVLFGVIIINIMFNLTAIAEGRKLDQASSPRMRIWLLLFVASLMLIFALLYLGDQATSHKRKEYLVSAASDLVSEQHDALLRISDYRFTKEYITATVQDINLLSKVDESFPQITVIQQDTIKNKTYLLGFNTYNYIDADQLPEKSQFILGTSSDERKYLSSVFNNKVRDYLFSSNNGVYEIYFPVETEKGLLVLHLTQHARYGKFGS